MVPKVAPGCWKKGIPESIGGWKGFFVDFIWASSYFLKSVLF